MPAYHLLHLDYRASRRSDINKRKTYYLSFPLLNFGPTGCLPLKWASKTSIQHSTWAFVHISSVLCGTGVGGAGVDAVEEDVVRGGVGSSILNLVEK